MIEQQAAECSAFAVELARGQVDAPIVEAHGDVEAEGVAAGEVEVDYAADADIAAARAADR